MPQALLTNETVLALENKSAAQILSWGLESFEDRIAFASSFGAEDVVVIDLISKSAPGLRIFTLDTGRLHEETYEVIDKVRLRYGVTIETFFPERDAVETLEREKGLFSFRRSIECRKECCGIRKMAPLRRALGGLDAWVSGLRRQQSVTRAEFRKAEIDHGNGGMVKLNPLADWSEDRVWDYVRRHEIPYNSLHDRGFPSIGCAPCTRAVRPGEDVRSGRWWWESPEQKECGLHARRSASPCSSPLSIPSPGPGAGR